MGWVGERLKAWGPHRIGGNPDIDGTITEVRDDGRVVVDEGDGGRTVVNPHGGWFLITIAGAVIIGALSL